MIRASGVVWTIVRPSGLFDHPAPTDYQVAEDRADGLFTARADLAAAMLAQLRDDRYGRRAMAVINSRGLRMCSGGRGWCAHCSACALHPA